MRAIVPRSREQAVLEKLRMLRVAKDLFLSEWYLDACRTLAFDQPACAMLATIAHESREERDESMKAIRKWSRLLSEELLSEGDATDAPSRVAHVARRDFLLHLIEAKEAAGEMLERAALLAPLSMREELERLAAIDFRHAVALRQLLVAEVHDGWRTRGEGPSAFP